MTGQIPPLPADIIYLIVRAVAAASLRPQGYPHPGLHDFPIFPMPSTWRYGLLPLSKVSWTWRRAVLPLLHRHVAFSAYTLSDWSKFAVTKRILGFTKHVAPRFR